LACALIAVIAGVLAIAATSNGWPSPSTLVRLATTDQLASLATELDPGFHLVPPQGHYDGQYYYAIALDPFATGEAHNLIDQANYRYGRPMHGWLAAVLSLGQPQFIPNALLFLSLAGLAIGGFAASRLSVLFGRTPWGGLIIAMSPGLLFATTSSTTEPMGTALAILLILAWIRRSNPLLIGVLSIVMSLYREQLLLVVLGILLYEGVGVIRRRSWSGGAEAGMIATVFWGPLALVVWFTYVHLRFGQWPSPLESGNTNIPFRGWLETFQYAQFLQGTGDNSDSQIGTTSPPYLIALAVLLLSAAWASRRVRTPIEGVLLAEVALVCILDWRTLVYPHEIFRIPSLAILAAIGVLLLRPELATSEPEVEPEVSVAAEPGPGV
jgi:hypothetical protein